MISDATLEKAAREYLDSEYSDPAFRIPFWRFLAFVEVGPTHPIHREEEGGCPFARIAVAIRRTARRRLAR